MPCKYTHCEASHCACSNRASAEARLAAFQQADRPKYRRNCSTEGCLSFSVSNNPIDAVFQCRGCQNRLEGKTREELEKLIQTAQDKLAELPVTIPGRELAMLKQRSAMLLEIEEAIKPSLHTYRDPARASQHLLDWLLSSNILRGQRI